LGVWKLRVEEKEGFHCQRIIKLLLDIKEECKSSGDRGVIDEKRWLFSFSNSAL
jgi:hypothetical protein